MLLMVARILIIINIILIIITLLLLIITDITFDKIPPIVKVTQRIHTYAHSRVIDFMYDRPFR